MSRAERAYHRATRRQLAAMPGEVDAIKAGLERDALQVRLRVAGERFEALRAEAQRLDEEIQFLRGSLAG